MRISGDSRAARARRGRVSKPAPRARSERRRDFAGVDVGAAIASREFPLLLPGGWVQGVERYFLVCCENFEPDLAALTDSEASYVIGWKWWSPEEIAASKELIYPEALANMLSNAGVG